MTGISLPPPSPTRRIWLECAALGLALVAFLVRCIPWNGVFSGGLVVYPDPDNYYHLWRALHLLDVFPAPFTFDPWISFPSGAAIPWPAGFDWMIALPGAFGVSQGGLAIWGALLPPLLGALATYLVYRLACRVFDAVVGLVAAALFAVMLGAVDYSFLGRLDHHALVASVVLGLYLAFLRSLQAQSRRSAAGWSLVAATLAAVCVACWIVTPPLYFSVIPLTAVLLRFAPDARRFRLPILITAAATLAFIAVAVVACADLAARPFALYQPSWFMVLLFAALCLSAVLACLPRRLLLVGVVGIGATLAGLLLAAPTVFQPLFEAVRVLQGLDPSYLFSEETAPLFAVPLDQSVPAAVARYTHLLFLAPILLAILIAITLRRSDRRAPRILFCGYALLGIVLILLQQRFGEYTAPALAILYAWALTEGFRRLWAHARRKAIRRLRLATLCVLLLAALFFALLQPIYRGVLSGFSQPLTGSQFDKNRRFLTFAKQFAAATPLPNGRFGVLVDWADSHVLLYATGQPVMVSSFGTPEALNGNRQAFRILLTPDEESAFTELEQSRIRYLVINDLLPEINVLARASSLPGDYIRPLTQDEGEIRYTLLQPAYRLLPTLYFRLFYGDGTTRQYSHNPIEPLQHFRLILDSQDAAKAFDLMVPRTRAFEVVRGARLCGFGPAGERVRLRLTIQSNVGRSFLYEREATAGPDGAFELVVPYATQGSSAPTRVEGLYRLKVGERTIHLDVPEEAVEDGLAVEIPADDSDPP